MTAYDAGRLVARAGERLEDDVCQAACGFTEHLESTSNAETRQAMHRALGVYLLDEPIMQGHELHGPTSHFDTVGDATWLVGGGERGRT